MVHRDSILGLLGQRSLPNVYRATFQLARLYPKVFDPLFKPIEGVEEEPEHLEPVSLNEIVYVVRAKYEDKPIIETYIIPIDALVISALTDGYPKLQVDDLSDILGGVYAKPTMFLYIVVLASRYGRSKRVWGYVYALPGLRAPIVVEGGSFDHVPKLEYHITYRRAGSVTRVLKDIQSKMGLQFLKHVMALIVAAQVMEALSPLVGRMLTSILTYMPSEMQVEWSPLGESTLHHADNYVVEGIVLPKAAAHMRPYVINLLKLYCRVVEGKCVVPREGVDVLRRVVEGAGGRIEVRGFALESEESRERREVAPA